MNKIKKIILSIIVFSIFNNYNISLANASQIENNKTNYRALVIGNDKYTTQGASALTGAVNDALKVEKTLKKLDFKGEKIDITFKADLTSHKIYDEINDKFKDNEENDISYIYYSGHGTILDNESMIVGVDMGGMTAGQFKTLLDKFKGKFIVMIDACNSGGFVNEFKKYQDTGKYKIITASGKHELAREDKENISVQMGGVFTRFLTKAFTGENIITGDLNRNGELSINELYRYTRDNVYSSSVQVYPKRDNFVLAKKSVEKFEFKKGELDEVWAEEFIDINKDKFLELNFDEKVDDKSIKNNVFILDKHNIKILVNDYKIINEGLGIEIYDLSELKKDMEYSLIIGKDLRSNLSKHNKNLIIKLKVK